MKGDDIRSERQGPRTRISGPALEPRGHLHQRLAPSRGCREPSSEGLDPGDVCGSCPGDERFEPGYARLELDQREVIAGVAGDDATEEHRETGGDPKGLRAPDRVRRRQDQSTLRVDHHSRATDVITPDARLDTHYGEIGGSDGGARSAALGERPGRAVSVVRRLAGEPDHQYCAEDKELPASCQRTSFARVPRGMRY